MLIVGLGLGYAVMKATTPQPGPVDVREVEVLVSDTEVYVVEDLPVGYVVTVPGLGWLSTSTQIGEQLIGGHRYRLRIGEIADRFDGNEPTTVLAVLAELPARPGDADVERAATAEADARSRAQWVSLLAICTALVGVWGVVAWWERRET